MNEIVVKVEGPALRDGIARIERVPAGGRARRVVSRSNMRPTGRYPSLRTGRNLCWDSVAELNWFRLLDCDPAVIEFVEQPCVVHYTLGGKRHWHVPDSLVRTADAQALWEVKTAADARKPAIAERTQLLAEHCPLHGYQYGVVLAEDLRREPRLRNVRQLLKHGRAPLSFEQWEYCRRLLGSMGALGWQDIAEGRHAPFTMGQACRLVIEGHLHLDLDRELELQMLRPVTAGGATGESQT